MQIFTYSCLEALNIGSQDRVSYVRRPFNPFQHCTVVCHLKNKPTRIYTQTLSHKCSFWTFVQPSAFVQIEKSKVTVAPYYLSYPLWRHKASGFDHRQPGLREHVNQLDFDFCRHYFLQKHNDAKALGFYERIQGACTSVSHNSTMLSRWIIYYYHWMNSFPVNIYNKTVPTKFKPGSMEKHACCNISTKWYFIASCPFTTLSKWNVQRVMPCL